VVRKESPSAALPDSPEGLLARKEVDAWVICLPEIETRDSASMHGATFVKLDWRFRGALSRALQAGALSNESGEVSILPCTRPVSDGGVETFRILSVGVRDRANVSSGELSGLLKNIHGLGLKAVGLSAADFGWSLAEAKKHFSGLKGVEACVTE
jgi:hypothetical protein